MKEFYLTTMFFFVMIFLAQCTHEDKSSLKHHSFKADALPKTASYSRDLLDVDDTSDIPDSDETSKSVSVSYQKGGFDFSNIDSNLPFTDIDISYKNPGYNCIEKPESLICSYKTDTIKIIKEDLNKDLKKIKYLEIFLGKITPEKTSSVFNGFELDNPHFENTDFPFISIHNNIDDQEEDL